MSLFDVPTWIMSFPKVPDPPSGLGRTFVYSPNAAFVPSPGVADTIANQVPSRPFPNPAFNLRGATAYSPAASQQNVLRDIVEEQRRQAELAKTRAEDSKAVTKYLMQLPGVTTSDESKAIDTSTIRSGTTGSSTVNNVPAIATGALTTGAPSDIEMPSTRTRTSTQTSTTGTPTTPSTFTTKQQETSTFFNYKYGGYYAPKQKQIR
jgi:hypothetical protein